MFEGTTTTRKVTKYGNTLILTKDTTELQVPEPVLTLLSHLDTERTVSRENIDILCNKLHKCLSGFLCEETLKRTRDITDVAKSYT